MARGKSIPEASLSSQPLRTGGMAGGGTRAVTLNAPGSGISVPSLQAPRIKADTRDINIDRVGSVIDFDKANDALRQINNTVVAFQDRMDTIEARKMRLKAVAGIEQQKLFFNKDTQTMSGYLTVEGENAVKAYPGYKESVLGVKNQYGGQLSQNARQKYELLVETDVLAALRKGASHAETQSKKAQQNILNQEFADLERVSASDPLELFSPDPVTGKSRVQAELAREPDVKIRIKKYDQLLDNALEKISNDKTLGGFKTAKEFLSTYGAAASGEKKLFLQERLQKEEEKEKKEAAQQMADLLTVKRFQLTQYFSNDVANILATGGTAAQVKQRYENILSYVPKDKPEKLFSVTNTLQSGLLDSLDLIQRQQGTATALTHADRLVGAGLITNASDVYGYGGRQELWEGRDREAKNRDATVKEDLYKEQIHTSNLKLQEIMSAPIGQRPRFTEPKDLINYVDKDGTRPFANLAPKTQDALYKNAVTSEDRKLNDLQYLTEVIVKPMEQSGLAPKNATDIMTIVYEKTGAAITKEAANQLFDHFELKKTENGKWILNQQKAAEDILRRAFPKGSNTFTQLLQMSSGGDISDQITDTETQEYYSHRAKLTQIVADVSVPVSERVERLDKYFKENIKQYEEDPIFANAIPPHKITRYVANAKQFNEGRFGEIQRTGGAIADIAKQGLERVQYDSLQNLPPEKQVKARAMGVTFLSVENERAFDDALQQSYPGAVFDPEIGSYLYTREDGTVVELKDLQVEP